jgi:hypothetical protein
MPDLSPDSALKQMSTDASEFMGTLSVIQHSLRAAVATWLEAGSQKLDKGPARRADGPKEVDEGVPHHAASAFISA